MPIVYAVISASYPPHGVVCAFTTPEAAEAWIREHGADFDAPRVEPLGLLQSVAEYEAERCPWYIVEIDAAGQETYRETTQGHPWSMREGADVFPTRTEGRSRQSFEAALAAARGARHQHRGAATRTT